MNYSRFLYVLTGIALWCYAVALVFSVSRTLGAAAIIGSVAFNLSENMRDK